MKTEIFGPCRCQMGRPSEYGIDALGRRVSKTVNGSLGEVMALQGPTKIPLAELDSSGSMVRRFVYGSQIQRSRLRD